MHALYRLRERGHGVFDLCVEALDLFVSLYGAEAGNLALKTMATGGVYVGGGIAPRILNRLQSPLFMAAFTSKGRMRPLLECIQEHIEPMRSKLRWGYDIPYMVTGQLNQHPRAAMKFMEGEDWKNIVSFFDSMVEEE